ncbi:MAG: hypothetical protein V1843_01720 [bacterium]
MNKTELFATLNPSISYQREIEGLLFDISRRDNIAEQEILSRDEIQKIMVKDIPRNQKIAEIKNALKKWRLPQLTEAQDNFDRETQKLKLPKNIKISPPQNFEGDHLNIEIRVKKPEDLSTAAKELLRIKDEISGLFYYL